VVENPLTYDLNLSLASSYSFTFMTMLHFACQNTSSYFPSSGRPLHFINSLQFMGSSSAVSVLELNSIL